MPTVKNAASAMIECLRRSLSSSAATIWRRSCGVMRRLQTGRDLEEALLERAVDRLEPRHGDAGLDEHAVELGAPAAAHAQLRRAAPLVGARAPSTSGTPASSSSARSGSSHSTISSARRAAREVGDRARRDDPPAVDDRRGVARLLDLVEQVRGEEHGAALADQRADHLAELEDPGRIEAVGRLVEDQQLGVGEQAARDAEALAHALRVARDLLVGAIGEPDARERAVDPRERLRAAHRGERRAGSRGR